MSSDGPPAYNLANHYAEDLRWAGRQLVLAKKYEEAMVKYTDAVTAFTRSGFEMGVGVCLTNRAIVAAKLGWWAESYCDAKLAARHFPKFAKAWFRAAMALEQLGMLRTAGALYYKAIEMNEALYAMATPALKRCRTANIAKRKEREKRELLLKLEAESEAKPYTLVPEGPSIEEATVDEVALAPIETEARAAISGELRPPPLEPHDSEEPRLWFGLGAGRCGLHSLATLVNLATDSAAMTMTSSPDYRILLWDPGEQRSDVVARKLKSLKKGRGVDVVGDINYAWLPYVPEILAQHPTARFVVMRRSKRECVESWFYWTEAGSLRQTVTHGTMAVHVHAKNHWMTHEQTVYDFNEWDLTMPKFEDARGKRDAIERYYDMYYFRCARLAQKYPYNFRFYDVEDLFDDMKLKEDLFAYVGIDDEPIDEFICENKQRYLYLTAEGDQHDAFLTGDFAEQNAGDDSSEDSDSSEAETSDDDDAKPKKSSFWDKFAEGAEKAKEGDAAAAKRDAAQARHERAKKAQEAFEASLKNGDFDERTPKERLLTVVVPAGASVGDTLRFTVRGETVSAAVPEGKKPGDKFQVPIPIRPDDVDHAPPPSRPADEPELDADDPDAALDADEAALPINDLD